MKMRPPGGRYEEPDNRYRWLSVLAVLSAIYLWIVWQPVLMRDSFEAPLVGRETIEMLEKMLREGDTWLLQREHEDPSLDLSGWSLTGWDIGKNFTYTGELSALTTEEGRPFFWQLGQSFTHTGELSALTIDEEEGQSK